MFFTGHKNDPGNVTQTLALTNTFNFTCVIYNASLAPEATPYFTVSLCQYCLVFCIAWFQLQYLLYGYGKSKTVVIDKFQIENLSLPVELHAQQMLAPLKLKFHPSLPNLHLTTQLILYTNASVFYIPLIIYNGKLKVSPTSL